jgi:hypothetical protein
MPALAAAPPPRAGRCASAYADQVHCDFEVFRPACREGRLTAQTESDYRADLSA